MPDAAPSCPRCGYDQSGAVAAWERSEPACCPLDGVCSECGLEFLWRDLLNPAYSRQLRFFENARQRLPASLALTVWRALRPRKFWSWVRMEHEVRLARLAVGVFTGVTAVYLLAVATLLLLAAVAGDLFGVDARPWFSYSWTETAVAIAWPLGSRDGYWRSPPQTVAPLAVVGLVTTALLPGTYVLLPLTLRRAKVRWAHVKRVWAYGWIGIPLVLLIPTTASMGTNMASHIFSGSIALEWGEWGQGRLEAHRWSILLGVVLAWDYWWWMTALRHYLRLPTAWGVAASTLALAILVSVALILIVRGGGMWLAQDW